MNEDDKVTRASLLLRVRDAQDAEAWAQFVEIYGQIVHGFCRARGLQEADAADVCQEVMKAVARTMEKFEYDRQQGKFRNWLLTVTRNKLNNFFASRGRQPEPVGNTVVRDLLDRELTTDEQSSWDREYHGRLFRWATDQVRPTVQETTWQAFWRTTIDQMDGAKVAAELNLSVGAVYVAKSRVLARLKAKIQSLDEEVALLTSP